MCLFISTDEIVTSHPDGARANPGNIGCEADIHAGMDAG